MALVWSETGRAADVLAQVQAVNPATLATDADRALRTAVITILQLLPAGSGVMVHLDNDDATHWAVQIQRLTILNFAT